MNNAPGAVARDAREDPSGAGKPGFDVNGQVGCRPIGVTWGLETSTNPFTTHPAWQAMNI